MAWPKYQGSIWTVHEHLRRPAAFGRGALRNSGRRGNGMIRVTLTPVNTYEYMCPRKNHSLLVVWAASNWDFVFYSFLLAERHRYINCLTCKERGLLPLELQFNLRYSEKNKFIPSLRKLSELDHIHLEGLMLLLLAAQIPGPAFYLHDLVTSGFFFPLFFFPLCSSFLLSSVFCSGCQDLSLNQAQDWPLLKLLVQRDIKAWPWPYRAISSP